MQVNHLSETAIELVLQLDEPLAFLPGQYINIQVPGTQQVRAYSFSSLPGEREGRFLIRNVPGGVMSQWLTRQAAAGDRLTLSGPMGSFYLRNGKRPLLMLAGGTGWRRCCRCCTPWPCRAVPGRLRCSMASPAIAIW